MTAKELKDLLDDVADTRELVLRADESGLSFNALYDVWRNARDDAQIALAEWLADGGAERYASYRAAQDREDVAQDGLASMLLRSVPA